MYNLLENVENKKNKKGKKEITKICEDIRINWKKAKTVEKKSDGKFSYFIKMYVWVCVCMPVEGESGGECNSGIKDI